MKFLTVMKFTKKFLSYDGWGITTIVSLFPFFKRDLTQERVKK